MINFRYSNQHEDQAEYGGDLILRVFREVIDDVGLVTISEILALKLKLSYDPE